MALIRSRPDARSTWTWALVSITRSPTTSRSSGAISPTGLLAVLGVIVGFGYGYVRDDGVAVIPIGALCP